MVGAVLLVLGLLGILLVVGAIGLLVVQGRRRPPAGAQYVALGSSFAAGIGLGPRAPGSPLVCMRTTNSYPQQLARLRGLTLVDMSCSGATTRHVLRGGQVFQGPQIDALGRTTELVTMTIGGNDIGYVGDLTMLSARRAPTLAGRALRRLWKGPRAQRDYAELQDDLLATLREIRRRAPAARILVVTYPTILPPQGTCPKLALDTAEVAMMRAVGEQLAEVTRAAAAEAGATLVDMQRLAAGHDACADSPWVNGWMDAAGTRYHPTLAGAEATARAIATVLDTM